MKLEILTHTDCDTWYSISNDKPTWKEGAMSSLNHAHRTAQMVQFLSGKKTFLVRSSTCNIIVWHGGKKRKFNTNQAAESYVNQLYNWYSE